MKAFYYENNCYNGILLVGKDGKWISYSDVIDGIEINRENIMKIVKNFQEYGYNDNDFQTAYDQKNSTLICGEDAQTALKEQDYSEEIYQKEKPEQNEIPAPPLTDEELKAVEELKANGTLYSGNDVEPW